MSDHIAGNSQLFELAPDAAFILSSETGQILNANRASSLLYGYNKEELMNMRNSDLSAEPEETLKLMKNLTPDCEKGFTVPVSYHRKKNGEVFPVEINAIPLRLNDKNVVYASCRDISLRIRKEQLIRENEIKWKILYSTLPVGISILDNKGNIVDFNEALGNILCINNGDLVMGNFRQRTYLRPDGEQMSYEDFPSTRAVKEQRPVNDVEIGVKIENGKIIWTKVSAAPLNLTDLSCIIATVDITANKQSEMLIRESEDRFSKAFKTSPFAIIITSPNDGRFIDVNDAFLAIFGYAREEVIGRTSIELNIWRNTEDRVKMLFEYNNGSKKIIGEVQLRRKNGETFPAMYSCDHIYLKNELCILSNIQDISKQKQSEDEHVKYIELIQRNQKLESLGCLAGGIAHDFNNLMGGIFGYINIASEATTEVKVANCLSKAMNTIDRARALTQQLLTFSNGGAPIQKTGNLFPFVQETVQFALCGSNVACRFDVPEDLWACNFDKDQIGLVINNLIINAQQAMPVGGTVDLSARNTTLAEKEHPTLKTGNFIKIAITDTGTGIPKEVIAKIFDPFFTTKAMGHGLGLATCYSIVNRHGGFIDVDSEPGKGSTFIVYLPALTETASSAGKKTNSTHRGNGTFLIMDDEEAMRDTISDMLKSFGYSVVSKNCGQEAVDFYISENKSNRKIVGMIFDLTVPGGMGGKEAIEEIRKIDNEIPVFVVSGYADDPVMKDPSEFGFMASICKPFRKSELSEMLNRYLQNDKI